MTDKQALIDKVNAMIRPYDANRPPEEKEFDSGWNHALWVLLEELGAEND